MRMVRLNHKVSVCILCFVICGTCWMDAKVLMWNSLLCSSRNTFSLHNGWDLFVTTSELVLIISRYQICLAIMTVHARWLDETQCVEYQYQDIFLVVKAVIHWASKLFQMMRGHWTIMQFPCLAEHSMKFDHIIPMPYGKNNMTFLWWINFFGGSFFRITAKKS